MTAPLPLTLGMLASAVVRSDHGLFAPWFGDNIFEPDPPEARIPPAIDQVIIWYDRAVAGEEPQTVTERQVREEFEGKGFWNERRDDGYAMSFDGYALREYAMSAIGDRGRKAEITG